MLKTSYICNCNVIHEDIVNDVKSKMQPKDDYIPVSYTHVDVYKRQDISALLFAFLNHFFNLPGSIPVLGWLLIFNTLIAGLITSFINAKLLEPITRLSKAMKEVSRGDFEQHLETNSRIAEVGESYQSFNVMTKELRATEMLQMDFVSNVSHEFKTPINAIEGYTMLLQGEDCLLYTSRCV